MKLFYTPMELARSGYIFRIIVNLEEKWADPYTIMFTNGEHLSYGPAVSLWGEGFEPETAAEWVANGEAKDLAYLDLDPHIQIHILNRVNEGWQDFLEWLETRAPRRRRDVGINEGGHCDAGKGIYGDAGRFFIRRDGTPNEDLGPFSSAREALINSLPDAYALAGPEYHSEVM